MLHRVGQNACKCTGYNDFIGGHRVLRIAAALGQTKVSKHSPSVARPEIERNAGPCCAQGAGLCDGIPECHCDLPFSPFAAMLEGLQPAHFVVFVAILAIVLWSLWGVVGNSLRRMHMRKAM
jgi:hypothetical protein